MLLSLKKIVNLLSDLSIDYCLIGGLAVSIYGIPRFTDDIDFLVSIDIKKVLPKLKSSIENDNGSVKYIKADLSDPLGDVLLITLNGNQVDLITAKSSYEFKALKRAKKESVQNFSFNVVAPEDLVILKLNAGGPQDLYDIAGILKVSMHIIDFSYIESNITGNYLKEKWEIVNNLKL